jgi:hypothetical protein
VDALQVGLKKAFNDSCVTKGLLSGELWYSQQAFRYHLFPLTHTHALSVSNKLFLPLHRVSCYKHSLIVCTQFYLKNYFVI